MANATTSAPANISPDLDVYFQNTAPTNGPAGGTYTPPATGSDVPTCSLGPTEGHILAN